MQIQKLKGLSGEIKGFLHLHLRKRFSGAKGLLDILLLLKEPFAFFKKCSVFSNFPYLYNDLMGQCHDILEFWFFPHQTASSGSNRGFRFR